VNEAKSRQVNVFAPLSDNFNFANFFDKDSLIPLALIVIATFFMVSSLRKRYRKPKKQISTREHAASAASPQRFRMDVESAIVELQELSRQIGSEIDTRFARLEAAIRDADRRIATLQRLNAKQPPQAHAPSEISNPSSANDEVDVRYTIVYDLADAGKTPVEIARELGKTPGEVELILNLRASTNPKPSSGA